MDHAADAAPWPSARGGRWLLAFAYTALLGWSAVLRSRGLSPPGLGQDDLWVAFLAKYTTLGDLLTYHAPVPMGFVAALKAVRPFVDDPELSLQIVPFACGLALIPLAGWVGTRLTRRWELGLLAAVLVSLHPWAPLYSVRVKQFTWDAAAALALLGVGLPRLDPEEPDRPWILPIAAATALVASFNTVFVGFVLCHVRILLAAGDSRRFSVGKAILGALAFDAFAGGLYFGRIADQSAPWIVEYWERRQAFPAYAASFGQGIDLDWLRQAIPRAFGIWLPPARRWMLPLAPIGLLCLLLGRRTRWRGLAFAGMALAIPTAALLRLYPFGGARTDFYFQPLLAILGAAGIGALVALVELLVRRVDPSGAWARRVGTTLLLLAGAALLSTTPPQAGRYGDGSMTTDSQDLVARMDAAVRPGDVLLLTPFSRWNVGYYTTLPLEVSFDAPEDERLFDFRFTTVESRILRNASQELRRPDLPDRLVVLSLLVGPKTLTTFPPIFGRAGYRLASEDVSANGGSALQVWERPPSRSRSRPR